MQEIDFGGGVQQHPVQEYTRHQRDERGYQARLQQHHPVLRYIVARRGTYFSWAQARCHNKCMQPRQVESDNVVGKTR